MRSCLATLFLLVVWSLPAAPPDPSTFSIVAADPVAGEVGVAVASKFFAVGAVVPFAAADIGAVATQSFANTSFGPRGLELLELGLSPQEALEILLRQDDGESKRQVGMVSASGSSATFSGADCNAWAGGRTGKSYAIQGNILVGEEVVTEVERVFIETAGKPLAERLFLALSAGDAAGGDARGRQSIAIIVKRAGAGYGGYTDQAVDIRVDDHTDPFGEMRRLLDIAMVWDLWNRAWTAFTEGRAAEGLPYQEQAAVMAESVPSTLPEVLYDLAVLRLAAGEQTGAKEALDRAVALNPGLADQAAGDGDLEGLE